MLLLHVDSSSCVLLKFHSVTSPELLAFFVMVKRSRPMESFVDLTSLKESPNAKVQGISGSMSELKKSGGCSYWDGEIYDEYDSRRVHSFDAGSDESC